MISLALLAKEYRVVYNSAIDDAFYVFNESGSYIRFRRFPKTFVYRLDITKSSCKVMTTTIVTAEEQKKHYSPLECTRAKAVRDIQHVLLCPNDEDLIHNIENNVVGYNDFTKKDVKVATGIWGKSEYGLKGKTPELKSKLMREDEAIDMPDEIKDKFENISLVVNACDAC